VSPGPGASTVFHIEYFIKSETRMTVKGKKEEDLPTINSEEKKILIDGTLNLFQKRIKA